MVLPHYSGKRHHWLDTSSIVYLLWMVFGAFLAVIGLLFLFERLGLPQEVVHGGILVFAVAAVMFLAMIGKTMTGAYYFFCDRQAKASVIGFSSGTDWAGGTFFIFFLAASPALKHLLAPSLVLGMFLLSGLFAALFYRSGALTLPGFFFWRYQGSASGWVALLITSLALFLLSLAELQVAAQMLPALGFSNQTAGLVILLGLALLPGLAGGWLSLMFVNVVLALWIIVAMTVPTFVVGFLPGVFTQDISDGPVRNLLTELPLPNLELTEPNSLLGSLTVIITLSCGFAVLPHALSRLALGRRSFAAIEHVGWGTLFVFVVLASFALSVGLLSSSGNQRLATLMALQPVLNLLPYLAVLFAAFNALAATLFAIACAVGRGLTRRGGRKTSDRALFATRMSAVAAALVLWALGTFAKSPLELIYLTGIGLCAAGLFVPVTAAFWVRHVPGWASGGAIGAGSLVALFPLIQHMAKVDLGINPKPLEAAFFGLFISLFCVVGGWFIRKFAPSFKRDQQAYVLRGEET